MIKKLLNIVNEEPSSVKIDEAKFMSFVSKVPIWDYAGIFKFAYARVIRISYLLSTIFLCW